MSDSTIPPRRDSGAFVPASPVPAISPEDAHRAAWRWRVDEMRAVLEVGALIDDLLRTGSWRLARSGIEDEPFSSLLEFAAAPRPHGLALGRNAVAEYLRTKREGAR